MIKFFNPDSIMSAKESTRNAPSGFRYGFIPNIFREDVYLELMANFPAVEKFKLVDKQSGGGRKRFFVGPTYDIEKTGACVCCLENLAEIWKDVLAESASPELVSLLRESIGIKFNSLSMFGFAFGNEGCMQEAHVDGVVRDNPAVIWSPIACLMYFNKSNVGPGGTCVYAADRKTVLFQAPGLRNGLLFFEQHPDAWHGYPMMPAGAQRRIVSLAYSTDDPTVLPATSSMHRLTCKHRLKHRLKSFTHLIMGK